MSRIDFSAFLLFITATAFGIGWVVTCARVAHWRAKAKKAAFDLTCANAACATWKPRALKAEEAIALWTPMRLPAGMREDTDD